MPLLRDIRYPIFLECCQYTDSSYWYSLFEDMAYGKPPSGTFFQKDSLCCAYKDKQFCYTIGTDPKKIEKELHKLLSEKLGLFSEHEKIRNKTTFDSQILEKNQKEWPSIKRKITREMFYILFVLKCKKKHGLTIKQAKHMLSNILVLLMFRTLTSKDVKYNGKEIVSIKDVKIENGKLCVKRPRNSNEDIVSTFSDIREIGPISEKKPMSIYWNKYIDRIKKIWCF